MAKEAPCKSWLSGPLQIPCRLTGPHEKCFGLQTLHDGSILEVEWKFHLPNTQVKARGKHG